jgi:hypothetical protein
VKYAGKENEYAVTMSGNTPAAPQSGPACCRELGVDFVDQQLMVRRAACGVTVGSMAERDRRCELQRADVGAVPYVPERLPLGRGPTIRRHGVEVILSQLRRWATGGTQVSDKLYSIR